MSIFPFSVCAYDSGSCVESPTEFQKFVTAEARRLGKSWYAFDVQINSQEHVSIQVFDLDDAVFGGIGPKIFRFEQFVSEEDTRTRIVQRATYLAEMSLRDDEARTRNEEISRRANALLAELAKGGEK